MAKKDEGIEDMVSKEYNKVVKYLQKQGMNPDEALATIKQINSKQPTKKSYTLGSYENSFILFSDSHMGNINYEPGLLNLAIKVGEKENVDFYADSGDIFDGWYQSRPSSIFEQNAVGFDNQMNLAVKELSQLNKPFYFITGNHSYNTFVRGAGVEAGPVLESRLKAEGVDAHFLGNAEGDLYLGKTKIRLLHPDGGSSYAISYKSQKIIESLESGKKPHLLCIGHFHKAEYLFYRNVHVIQSGTLCGQTKFMKGKGIAAHKGFWHIKLNTKKNGEISYIEPRFYAAYK